MGLTGLAKKALEKGKHEIKERANPLSQRNKAIRQERKDRRAKLQYTEQESYRREQESQAEKRGQRKAQREYNPPQQKSGGGKRRSSGGSGMFSMGNLPGYREAATFTSGQGMFQAPDPWGNPVSFNGKSSKPKPATKNTTIKTGGRTITIREQAEDKQEERKKKTGYEFKDPFSF